MSDKTKKAVRLCYLLLVMIRSQAEAKGDFKNQYLTLKLLWKLTQVVGRSPEYDPQTYCGYDHL